MGRFDEAKYGAIPPTWGSIRSDRSQGLFSGLIPLFPVVAYKKNLGFYLFCVTVVVGTCMGISRVDWLGVWFGLEVNLFRAIPLFLGSGSPREAESILKYFLMQGVGSGMLLGGALINLNYLGVIYVTSLLQVEISLIGVCLGIIIKAGLAPFHFWLPRVIRGLRWEACFLLRVWQKVGPLLVIISFVEGIMGQALLVRGGFSSVIGGLGGFPQTQIRVLLGYSSIGHMGWLVAGGVYRILRAVIYFLLYAVIRRFLFYFLSVVRITSYKRVCKIFGTVRIDYLLFLGILILRLAGLPPTIGFSIKWAVVLVVCSIKGFQTIIVLILGSLLRLYYYTCLAFSWYLFRHSLV